MICCGPLNLHEVHQTPHHYRYDYEVADYEAQLELLKVLFCTVIILGYSFAFYDRVLTDWHGLSL